MKGSPKEVSERLFESASEICSWPMFRKHKFTVVREERQSEVKFCVHVDASHYPIFEISSQGPDTWTKPVLMIRQQSHNVESLAKFVAQVGIIQGGFAGAVSTWEREQEGVKS